MTQPDEQLEVTITIGEDKVREMLTAVTKAKVAGDHSAIVEFGAINFMVYAMASKKLKDAEEKGLR